jgi:hypothetical protein
LIKPFDWAETKPKAKKTLSQRTIAAPLRHLWKCSKRAAGRGTTGIMPGAPARHKSSCATVKVERRAPRQIRISWGASGSGRAKIGPAKPFKSPGASRLACCSNTGSLRNCAEAGGSAAAPATKNPGRQALRRQRGSGFPLSKGRQTGRLCWFSSGERPARLLNARNLVPPVSAGIHLLFVNAVNYGLMGS